jgi:hypothetical protein
VVTAQALLVGMDLNWQQQVTHTRKAPCRRCQGSAAGGFRINQPRQSTVTTKRRTKNAATPDKLSVTKNP